MNSPAGPTALQITAEAIEPGDYLPPQRALHGTSHRDTGFQVGPDTRDVTSTATLSGSVLLFGRGAPSLALPETTPVLVHRPAA